MEHINKNTIEERLQKSYPLSGRWHNGFHLEMPFGLINDPNGLTVANGEYHIFFQWNPLGCEHKNKCWAYTKTRDFVHYSRPKLAMKPTDTHDKDGCYSGCGLEEDGNVRVLYTCNAKDEAGVRTPAQRFGTLLADGTIRKEEIAVPKEAAGYTAHFRDPYVFQRNGRHYFVLGAQNKALQGRAVVYGESVADNGSVAAGENAARGNVDGRSWDFLGEIQTGYPDFGYMWECPNILQFGDSDVLLFCPQGLAEEEYAFQNRYQSGYVSGRLNLDSMVMEHGDFHELDRGFDFYAPQVAEHDGRHIMFGWMGMPEEEAFYPSAEDGWIYSLTVPRELTLKDGMIYQQPVAELEALRLKDSERKVQAKGVCEHQSLIAEQCEVQLAIQPGTARHVSLVLAYGEEQLVFSYDRVKQVMTIDRSGMQLGARGVRRFRLPVDNVLKLHLLVDKSALEVFFQDGQKAAAMLIFPAKETVPQLIVKGDSRLVMIEGSIWELQAQKIM